MVSPLGGPHSIRGVVGDERGAKTRREIFPLSIERGSRGALVIEPGADFKPAAPPLFGTTITSPVTGPAPALPRRAPRPY